MIVGKWFYQLAFWFQKSFALLSTGLKADIWYRNSLLLDYFQFGKSDIDVTIIFHSDKNLIRENELLSQRLHLCPLIKEINTYYHFSLGCTSTLINAFELQKDPNLQMLVSSENSSPADQFVYLLRMYFSNLSQKVFSDRDRKKWTYHFSRAGKQHLTSKLHAGMERRELLNLITTDQPQALRETLQYAAEHFQKGTELYEQYIHCANKELLAMVLPQHFCFAETSGEMKDPLIEAFFLSQMSWELWALMTQPYLFAKNGPGLVHLKNVIKALSRNKTSRSEELKKIAEDFERFSSNHL